MIKRLLILMILLLLFNVYAYNYKLVYSLNLEYKDGKLILKDINLLTGEPPDRKIQPKEGYTVKLTSFNKEELYSFKFEVIPFVAYEAPREWFDKEGNQIYVSPELHLPEVEAISILIIPYFSNAKQIEIYNENEKLELTIDVSRYALCNEDNICNNKEDSENCPNDCKKPLLAPNKPQTKMFNTLTHLNIY